MNESLVLLVEDDPNDRALALRAMKDQEIANELVIVQDGAEALEFLFGTGRFHGRDLNAAPALILLDLKLPKLSGLDVLRRIRADVRTKLVPVVILTSSIEAADLVAAYSSGCNSYVRKPVNYQRFTELLRTLAKYWLNLNEHPLQMPS